MPDPSTSLSALPSRAARALAFAAVCLGGALGAVVGYAVVKVQCEGQCAVPLGIGILVGSVSVAAGTAVVSVLALRALGEWREISDRA